MSETDRFPTIDISLFLNNNEEDSNDDQINAKKKKIKEVIHQACSECGFFKIVNHGIPKGLMSRALELSKMFFECPDDEKLKCSLATPPVGYNRLSNSYKGQNEYFWFTTRQNLNNCIYPDGALSEFWETSEELLCHLTETRLVVERILSECLNLPPNFLHEYTSEQTREVIVYRCYQPAKDTENNGLHGHQDPTYFTFVIQDDVGGLDVLVKDDIWIPVIPSEGSIIVNIGDVLQVLSNNRYNSATHRVVRPTGERSRHSIVSFYYLDGDTWVEPLPQFTSEIGEKPKYRGFYYKDYSALRNSKVSTHEDITHITHYAIPE